MDPPLLVGEQTPEYRMETTNFRCKKKVEISANIQIWTKCIGKYGGYDEKLCTSEFCIAVLSVLICTFWILFHLYT
jgi:hypothetical protein